MPTYFDIFNGENLEIDATTIIYLVRIGRDLTSGQNIFAVKAISGGLERLPADPTSAATAYWPIDNARLLLPVSLANTEIFPGNELRKSTLTAEQAQELFGIDTVNTPSVNFVRNEPVVHQHQNINFNNDFDANNPHVFFPQEVINYEPLYHQLREAAVLAHPDLFTYADIADMDQQELYLIQTPECLAAMRPGPNNEAPLFNIADIAAMDAHQLSYIQTPQCLAAMRPGLNNEAPLFRIADIAGIHSHNLGRLLTPAGLQLLRPDQNNAVPLYTIAEIAAMDDMTLYNLIHPEIIHPHHGG